jgi:hypothetical protein
VGHNELRNQPCGIFTYLRSALHIVQIVKLVKVGNLFASVESAKAAEKTSLGVKNHGVHPEGSDSLVRFVL